MLDIKNLNDINEIKKYGKARDILYLFQLFPNINPYTDMKIISNLQEWEIIKDNYPDIFLFRADCPIGKKVLFDMPTNGQKTDIPMCLEKIKETDESGVLLLLNNKTIKTQRHKMSGGFNVSINIDSGVAIEFVGKGFDGRELTKSLAVHESYFIPWDESLFVNCNSKDKYLKKNVGCEEYLKSREERINYLQTIGVSLQQAKDSVPEYYKRVNDSVFENVLDNIVFQVVQDSNVFKQEGLTNFGIGGNIDVDENGFVMIIPFGLFKEERFFHKERM